MVGDIGWHQCHCVTELIQKLALGAVFGAWLRHLLRHWSYRSASAATAKPWNGEQMSTLDDIAQERQRIAERLARIDSERAKLAEQLGELEAAERVLSRFGQPKSPAGRRGRRARTAEPAKAVKAAKAEPRRGRQRRGRGRGAAPAKSAPALGDATLRAVA